MTFFISYVEPPRGLAREGRNTRLFAVLQRRHRRSHKAHFPLMRALMVVRVDPHVEIRLQLFGHCVDFLAEANLVEVVQGSPPDSQNLRHKLIDRLESISILRSGPSAPNGGRSSVRMGVKLDDTHTAAGRSSG